MKKSTFLSLALVAMLYLPHRLSAQQISNGGFENWTTGPNALYEDPDNWGSSNFFTWLGSPATVIKTTDAHTGDYALKGTNVLSDIDGNGIDDTIVSAGFLGVLDLINNLFVWGEEFQYRPDSLVGWYKYSPVNNDTLSLSLSLTKWNPSTGSSDTLALTNFYEDQNVPTYTRFSIPINYINSQMPDSIAFEFQVGMNQISPDSEFFLDDLTLIYTSQAGIKEITTAHQNGLSVFPNPSIEKVTILSDISTNARVFNSVGIEVYSVELQKKNPTSMSVADLKSGVYFIKTTEGETYKFSIEH